MNKKIPLDIDHIDGNPDNHEESNLRLLCPNCHRQTETWGSKNVGAFPDSIRSKIMKNRRKPVLIAQG